MAMQGGELGGRRTVFPWFLEATLVSNDFPIVGGESGQGHSLLSILLLDCKSFPSVLPIPLK